MSSNDTTPDEATPFRVIGPPPDGFTILYNDAAHMLIAEHSAVVKCYLALCVRTNATREAFASMTRIAEDMQMSVPSANRAVARLEEMGLLAVNRPETVGRGRANEYRLLKPITHDISNPINTSPGDQKSITGENKSITGDRPTRVREQDNVEQETNAHAPARERNPTITKEDLDRLETGGNPVPPRTGRTKPVSNTVGTFKGPENEHPYWAADTPEAEQRLFLFEQVAERYPDDGAYRLAAMAAWRTTIGTALDPADYEHNPLFVEIWAGVTWYGNKAVKEKTEAKYITRFPNWISGRKWTDAPKSAQEEVRKHVGS